MASLVSLNGVVVPASEARVPVLDRGFLYGDSVFEVLRTYGGRPFALEDHLGRLARSARQVGIAMPVAPAQLRREIELALGAAGNPESYVRVVITRGGGELGLDPALARDPLRMVLVAPLRLPPPEAYRAGVTAVTVAVRRDADPALGAGAKTSNYLANILALREARRRGGYEAFLVDPEHGLLEGNSSNVFLVAAGALHTPALALGILAGITRAYVLEAAGALGVACSERPIPTAELWTADEVFLTSSLREVVPVVRVDEHQVGAGAPGVLTRALHRAFRAHTPPPPAPLPWE